MSQDQQSRGRAWAARRKVWLLRLYLMLRFFSRVWEHLPLPAVGAVLVTVAFLLYFGLGNIAGYIPGPTAIYRFFRPVKHGCSQTYDFKTGRNVWADDLSPADPPMPGYTWDAWKCDFVPPQRMWLRRQ